MEFKEIISEEVFYKRVYKKSYSKDAEGQVRAAVSNIKYYCKDEYDEDSDVVLSGLKNRTEYSKNGG